MAGADWEPGPLGIGGGVAEYTNGRGGHRRGEKHSFIFLLKQGGVGRGRIGEQSLHFPVFGFNSDKLVPFKVF